MNQNLVNYKVSILIPSYNNSKYIRLSIESALSQVYENLEVIVSDDNSSDDSLNIIKSIYDKRYKFFINKENIGRVKNYRKLLFNYATGDYVLMLDGDDFLTDKYFINDAIKLIKYNNIAIVSAKIAILKKGYYYYSKQPKYISTNGLNILRKMPSSEFNLTHMSTLYNRNLAMYLDFYRSDTISSDWESIYRIILQGNVIFLNKVIGVWRIHDSNISSIVSITDHLKNLAIWIPIYSDAYYSGMNKFQCEYRRNLCILDSIISSATVISRGRIPKNTFIFIIKSFYLYKKSLLLLIISPIKMIKLFLILFEFYI